MRKRETSLMPTLSPNAEAYAQTVEKLELILQEGGRLARLEAWSELEELFLTLREYKHCFYCVKNRLSLEVRSLPGACNTCALHKYAERLSGRPLAYNGCYHVPAYDQMVRAALMFERIQTEATATRVFEGIRAVIAILRANQQEFSA